MRSQDPVPRQCSESTGEGLPVGMRVGGIAARCGNGDVLTRLVSNWQLRENAYGC